ncbi:hypothetical protein LEP1GSC049_1763 [Leptospira kirschneri serovar Cynopteri str. 3522 CT]|nr:hypothetical protein LEP1GSC064_2043 [Leptospira kirschneri serovar Grippotyphosa str. Moskva]EKR07394.1 hypothetical protein LEP1GSC122_2672 [Leptospira kirschneri serovar Valbuzzi str. 200702274]EPG51524.1 hypothetical protein LEP1GSC049_1763 [Leptospira kirschneri serovar Cynopteri str. 3522 CT]
MNNVHFYPSDSKIFFQLVGKVMALYESRCGVKLLVFYEN